MLEIGIDSVQLSRLNTELELTTRDLLKIATRSFKTCAKNFTKKAIKSVKKKLRYC